ncbi:cell wall anchor protein [Bacillus marasmi]|uniref:cell wall anchor protein n=1 Tax=Bacillus marasmi TaxID=1926279 RepID=UPI0011C8C1B0|nr:cell wall anchor protein [Bacillus marasmi]
MELNKLIKKMAIITVCGVGITAFSPTFADAATPADENAKKLVEALKVLEVDQVDYLYAYMQSVKLTDGEYNSIVANAEKVAAILKSVSSPTALTDANRAEIGRLFLDSAQKAHIKIAFVDKTGKTIDLTSYSFDKGLKLQIMDLNGKILATIDPDKSDLNADILASKVAALKTAVTAKVELDKTGKFTPIPEGELPNTASDLPLNIALGGLLIAMGVVTLKPALKIARKAN